MMSGYPVLMVPDTSIQVILQVVHHYLKLQQHSESSEVYHQYIKLVKFLSKMALTSPGLNEGQGFETFSNHFVN